MEPLTIISIALVGVVAAIIIGCCLSARAERRAWASGPRYVVRQSFHGQVTREWKCVNYWTSDGKIFFKQQGHKDETIVSGEWHVEPLAATK